MTLTHSCNNAFADSAGVFEDVEQRWGGLSYVFFFLASLIVPGVNMTSCYRD